MISTLAIHFNNKVTGKEKRRYTSKDGEIIRESEGKKEKEKHTGRLKSVKM